MLPIFVLYLFLGRASDRRVGDTLAWRQRARQTAGRSSAIRMVFKDDCDGPRHSISSSSHSSSTRSGRGRIER